MAAREKSKPESQDQAPAESAAVPTEPGRKTAAADKKKVGKKNAAEKTAEKPDALSAKPLKPAKQGGAPAKAGKSAKATKAGKDDGAPINPAIAWPFPLGPRPQ